MGRLIKNRPIFYALLGSFANKKIIYFISTYKQIATAINSSNLTSDASPEIGVPALVKNPLVNLSERALIANGKVKPE